MARKLFECFICRQNFKSKKSNLLRHMRLHGPTVECYRCPQCPKSFQNKQNYQRHWADKHTDISIQPAKPTTILRQAKRM